MTVASRTPESRPERLGSTQRLCKTHGFVVWFAVGAAWLIATAESPARRPDGRLEVTVVDDATGEPVPARLHLTDVRGKPVSPTARRMRWGVAPLDDHAYLQGPTPLALRRGAYRFTIDAGPEYRTRHGHFEIVRHAEDTERVAMQRAVRLGDEGWHAADWIAARPAADLPLLLEAEQLAHAGMLAAAWDGERWSPTNVDDPPAGPRVALWASERGVVWLIDVAGETEFDALPDASVSSVGVLREARRRGMRVVAAVASPELPLWIAHDLLDGVVVIDGWLDSPAGAAGDARLRQPDPLRYPGPQGKGRWRRALYEALVESHVLLPPLGISGSGVRSSTGSSKTRNERPLGDGRTYATFKPTPIGLLTGAEAVPDLRADAEAWWDAAGRLSVVATNGPLLRPAANGRPPGEAFFLLPRGGPVKLSVSLSLTTRTPIEYLELVKNGEVVKSVRLAELARSGGLLPELRFDRPGWAAVVAATEASDRYEFAMSAPWVVLGGGMPRVSVEAVRGWIAALTEAREQFGSDEPLAYDEAERFWQTRLAQAE